MECRKEVISCSGVKSETAATKRERERGAGEVGEKERERKWLLVAAKGGTIFHKRRKQAAERVTATETVGSVGGEKPTVNLGLR